MKNENRNTKDFHLKRKFSYNKIKAYHQKYIDTTTGYFKNIYTEMRNCPVCNNVAYFILFNKSGGSYVRCNKCDMIFLNPVFKEPMLKEYYMNLDTEQTTIVENESDFYREIYTMGLKKIKRNTQVGSILDIGCGGGFFLDIAKENNWVTSGIEPCKSDREICKKKDHQVQESLDNIGNKKFDVITLWDVFEHIPSPNQYLYRLSSLLEDNGLVFIQTPNSNSIASRVLQNKCNMFDGLEHVNIYNPETIELVLKNNGFAIVDICTVISELGVVNNYLNYRGPYFGDMQHNSNVLGFINEKTIHNHMLGYKLQILCKKDGVNI